MAKVLFLLCIPEEDEADNAKKNKKEEAKDSDADTPKHGSGVDAEKKPGISVDDQIQGSAKSQELPASSKDALLAVDPRWQDERKTSITSAPGGTVSSDIQAALRRQSSPSSTTKSVPADVKKAMSTPAKKDNSAFSSQPALSSPQKEKSELPMSTSPENKEDGTPKILIQNENAEEIRVEAMGKEGTSAAALPAVSQAEETQGVTTEGGNPLDRVKDDYWDFDSPVASVEGLTIEDEFHDCEEGTKKSKASKKVKPKKRDSSPPNSAKSKQDEKKKVSDSKAKNVEESEFVTCPNTPVPQSKFTVEPVSDKPQEGTGKVTADPSPDTSEKSKMNTDKFTVEPVAVEPKPVSGKSEPDVELPPPKTKQSSSNPTPEAVSVPVLKSSSAAVKLKESGLEQAPGAHTVPATGGTSERNGSLPGQLETRRSSTPSDSQKDIKAGSEEFEMVEFLPKTTMRKQVRECLEGMGVKNMAWQKCVGDKVWQVTFIEETGNRCEEIMLKLENIGVGRVKKSSVSVLPVTIHCDVNEDTDTSEADEEAENEKIEEKVKQMEEKASEFKKSIRSRLVVQQVVKSVEANALFTFDYVMLVVLASMIAALGLVENSSVILVASMLISPLMGPILAGTFGIVIKNSTLRNIGVRSELYGLALCLICGFVCGLIPACLEASSSKWRTAEEWPTLEMSSRGVARGLLVGIMIAVPSGAGVALSVLGGNTGSLVGVAISASLLPPAVNAGMLWSAALMSAIVPPPKVMEAQINNFTETINGTDINRTETIWVTKLVTEGYGLTCPQIKDNEYRHTYFCSTASDFAFLGVISLVLTVLNIFFIFVMGIVVMKIKEVAPKTTTQSDKTFFKTDLKVARESYTTAKGPQSALMGKKWLEEYKAMKQQMEPDTVEEGDDADTREFAELLQSVENSPDVMEVLGRINRSSRPMSEEMAPVFDQAYSSQQYKNPPSTYTTITHATYSGHYPTLRPHVSHTMFQFPPGSRCHTNSPRQLSSTQLTMPPLSAPIYTPIIEGEVLDTVQSGRRKPRKALRLRMPQKTYHVTPLGGKKTKAAPANAGTSSDSSGRRASSTDTNGEDSKKAKAPKKARFMKGKRGKSFQSDAKASLLQIDEEVPMLETRPSNKNKNQNTSFTRI
ncbi:uncharacterized protein [Littorina saxatilis]|uniref:uncharacterized protein isoform X3 n=1 Tax=Littorina saxatilis TaxID=31220 RepID=UPI0038B6859E